MKSCNTKILELFYNADNTGRIIKPEAIGRFGENNDGLIIELSWRVSHEVIVDAKFRAFANPNAIAICSLMTKNFVNKTIEEVMNIDESVIEQELGELLPEYLEVYDAVKEAMADAYNNYLKRFGRVKDIETEVGNEQVVEDGIEENIEEDLNNFDDELEDLDEVDLFSLNTQQQVEVYNALNNNVIESVNVEVDQKRGRGRPRKIIDASVVGEIGEKRGRGRPRKEIDPNAIVEVGEKRGRGRPRKPVDPNAIIEVGEKRGRGRPRKPVDENAIVEIGEKRGRGRPRKSIDPNSIVEVGEKRGRGRPRKEVDPNAIVEVGEKRGRGRPRKEPFKYNLPSDLDEVIDDEVVESLIGGGAEKSNNTFSILTTEPVNENKTIPAYMEAFKVDNKREVSNQESNTIIENSINDIVEDDIDNTIDEKDANEEVVIEAPVYDGVDVDFGDFEFEKRGRGRPIKVVDEFEQVGEKRGRGRPRKDSNLNEETIEKREPVRSVEQPVNSLTRSLSPTSQRLGMHNTQDIVFASKNVTTTNININVTKTTETKDSYDEYSHNVNISKVQESSKVAKPAEMFEDEIDEDDVKLSNDGQVELSNSNTEMEFEEDFDELDISKVKDEAPKGGIEDLLKALLEED